MSCCRLSSDASYLRAVPGAFPSTSGAGEGPAGMMPHMVPQLKASPLSQQPLPRGLTKAQQSELEMARRRAQKAAEGKAANAAVSRRVKRKAHEEEEDDDMSHMQNEEIEAKLASITDVKEAKRLKRCASPAMHAALCESAQLFDDVLYQKICAREYYRCFLSILFTFDRLICRCT